VLARLSKDVNPIFTIIGDGPERERVQSEVARLGLEESIEVLGSQSPERVREILAATTLFALPTIREAFSIAALEARCAGVPVVAMNHGGVGDVVKDQVHGFLTMDLQEFAERIAELLCDAALRDRMRQAVTQELDHFLWPRVVEATLDSYGTALAMHGHRLPMSLAPQAAHVPQ